MKFEKLSESNGKSRKMFLYGFLMCAVLLIIINMFLTKAKYKVVDSAKLVNSTISYSNADFSLIAVYQQKVSGDNEPVSCVVGDDCYERKEIVPENGYKLNNERTYCEVKEQKLENDNKVDITYKKGLLTFAKVKEQGTKCYLYFDSLGEKDSSHVLAKLDRTAEPGTVDGFEAIDTTEHTGSNGKTIMYSDEDDFGTTYYFRGKVKDNWVQYGKTSNNQNIYWRIIRINGDGSIRLIYAGVGTDANSLTDNEGYTGNKNSQFADVTYSFDGQYSNNRYVGFQFVNNDAHGTFSSNGETTTAAGNSKPLTNLYTWFETNLLDEWNDGNGQIDTNAGFCNDRRNSKNSGTKWGDETDDGGKGSTQTYYGAWLRLRNTPKIPTFKCKEIDKDYFTYLEAEERETINFEKTTAGTKSLKYPIGMITADEVVYAGGYINEWNKLYYLYTGEDYWTMSPYEFNGSHALVLRVDAAGAYLEESSVWSNGIFLRPVINLRSGTKFTRGSGLYNDPYVVS